MWYVNSHLQYIHNPLLRCFILTMWYVNEQVIEDIISSSDRFILTMWYVNMTNVFLQMIGVFAFYINYGYVNKMIFYIDLKLCVFKRSL